MKLKEPFTVNELEKWNSNKNINPRTQRKKKKIVNYIKILNFNIKIHFIKR